MTRYVQIKTENGYEYVERGSAGDRRDMVGDHYVQADIGNFRSPIDGSVITSRRALREHNARHNVINEWDLGTERERRNYFARREAERRDVRDGTAHTVVGRRNRRERRDALAAAIRKLEGR